MSFRDRSLGKLIRDAGDLRRVTEADIRLHPYAYPIGDRGLAAVRMECNEDEVVVVSGPRTTWAPGSTVMVGSHSGDLERAIVGPEPFGRRGMSAFALDFPPAADVDLLAVISAEPFYLVVGAQVVTLTGEGFAEDPVDVFEAVLYDLETGEWELDSEVEIGPATWVSDTEVTVTVTVAASAVPSGAGAARLINVRPTRG